MVESTSEKGERTNENESQTGPSETRTSNTGPVDEIPTNSENDDHDDNIGNGTSDPDTAANPQDEKEEENIHNGKEQNGEEEEKQCYICWESDTTDENNPIRRDCGCKGSGGWVHLNCLLQSAEIKARESVLDPLVRSWSTCPFCVQPYQDPTQAFLRERMIHDLPRLQERLLSSAKVALLMWANIILVLAVVWYSQVFLLSRLIAYALVKGERVLLPKFSTMWSESSLIHQILLGCVFVVLLVKILNERQASIGRFLVRWVLWTSFDKVVSAATMWRDLQSWNYSQLALEVGCPLLALAAGAYHFRRELRDEHIQIRHQNVLQSLSQLAFGFVLGVLCSFLAISSIVQFLLVYQEELNYETWGYTPEDSSIVERIMLDVKLSRFLEGLEVVTIPLELFDFDIPAMDQSAVAIAEKPFREDYWYCCAW